MLTLGDGIVFILTLLAAIPHAGGPNERPWSTANGPIITVWARGRMNSPGSSSISKEGPTSRIRRYLPRSKDCSRTYSVRGPNFARTSCPWVAPRHVAPEKNEEHKSESTANGRLLFLTRVSQLPSCSSWYSAIAKQNQASFTTFDQQRILDRLRLRLRSRPKPSLTLQALRGGPIRQLEDFDDAQ